MASKETLRRCARCVMPDTRPRTRFVDGVCQACLNYEKRHQINWDNRFQELIDLCAQYRDKGKYNCAVAVSGGKDSHFIVHALKELDLRLLLITISDPFTPTRAGKHNLDNILRLGGDHIRFTPHKDSMIKAIRHDFEKTGEPLKYLEKIIYTKPVEIAHSLNIPLVFFGEDSAYDYGATDKEVPSRDGVYFMGYYSYWESTRHYAIAKYLGFKDLTGEWERKGCSDNFEQIESYGYMIHLWLKYPKFGFQRVSDIESRRIREALQSRDNAMRIVQKYDSKVDPKALADFCSTLGYSQSDFWRIVKNSDWNKYLK